MVWWLLKANPEYIALFLTTASTKTPSESLYVDPTKMTLSLRRGLKSVCRA
jgi:hypothetical protein